jgi:glycosyltransferase involved in cell wall biosynthesis
VCEPCDASILNSSTSRVAVVIPCFNEAAAIAHVIAGFRQHLPAAVIYVYDNNSVDGTILVARQAGAIVRSETMQGKGNVVRRMLSDIEADIYVMADGDGTYDPADAPKMVRMIQEEQYAMVVGRRISLDSGAYRRGHVFGNRLFTRAVEWLFGRTFTDILSGYRAVSLPFVRSFPAASAGFEIETELTIHALTLRLPVKEIETAYSLRTQGSESKLNTYRDGIRIVGMILRLFRSERPQLFYSLIGFGLWLLALALAYPLFITFVQTGLVPRLPTAVLATGIAIAGLLSFSCGLILDTVTRGRREAKLLAYLAAKAWRD